MQAKTLKTRQARRHFAKRKKREERLRLAKHHRRTHRRRGLSIMSMPMISPTQLWQSISWWGQVRQMFRRVAALF